MAKKKQSKPKKVLPVMPSPFDFLGSWTGTYLMGIYEEPDQDVDDL